MDQTIFEETMDNPSVEKYAVSKEMLYVQDQQGGAYNGQVRLDTSILANSGRWCDYKEGYLEVPFKITFKSSVDSTGAGVINGFILGLKNGNHHLVNSLKVDYNNTTLVQATDLRNVFVGYKLMSSFSEDDLKKHGATIGFHPDSAGSYNFAVAASRNGEGHCNNVVNPVAATPVWAGGVAAADAISGSSLDSYNKGFLERLKTTSFGAMTADVSYGGVPVLGTDLATVQPKCQDMRKNFVTDNAEQKDDRVWQWNITATIRLKDICDLFAEMPIVKGAFMKLTIGYNSTTYSITSAAAASPTLIHATITQRTGRCSPIMMASAGATNPCASLLDGTNTISCGIGTGVPNQIGNYSNDSVRLYVPAYELSPQREKELLTRLPERDVYYNDIFLTEITSISAGSTFNEIITNGQENLQYIVVVPVLNSVAGNAATLLLDPLQSIFDSCPGTTCPLASITNFNVQVSGKNVFQENVDYDYSAFCDELQSINALNGGVTTGLTSGLISKYDFDNAYRYYVADLSRYSVEDEGIPKSVTVKGKNNTAKIMNYYCFLVHRKQITINMSNGGLKASDTA